MTDGNFIRSTSQKGLFNCTFLLICFAVWRATYWICIVTELGDTFLTLWEVLFQAHVVCLCLSVRVCFPLLCSSNNQSPAADLNFDIMFVTITRLHMVVEWLSRTVWGRGGTFTWQHSQTKAIFALTLSKIHRKNLHRPLLLGCSIAVVLNAVWASLHVLPREMCLKDV